MQCMHISLYIEHFIINQITSPDSSQESRAIPGHPSAHSTCSSRSRRAALIKLVFS